MRTSVSLSVVQGSATAPILFTGATEENFAKIQELGYDGIDLFVDDPLGEPAKQAGKWLEKYDLGVGVVMPAALAGQGLYLGDEDPSIRQTCQEKIGEIIHYAGDLGGMVSLGLVRGSTQPGETLEHFYGKFVPSCEKLLAVSPQVPLVLEPINRYEINTLCSAVEAVAFIQTTGLPLFLMLDTFHMNIEDVDIPEAFRLAMPYTKHIHFLDSNRLAPGMGHLDMEGLYQLFAQLGYQGYLCLEALPRPDTLTCATKGAEFFKKVRQSQ